MPVTSVFGQTQYLRDSFKAIDYLVRRRSVQPLLVRTIAPSLRVDGGVGVVWEQNTDLDLQTDGAVTAGRQFSHKLTATTELNQKAAALWKMDDFGERSTPSARDRRQRHRGHAAEGRVP